MSRRYFGLINGLFLVWLVGCGGNWLHARDVNGIPAGSVGRATAVTASHSVSPAPEAILPSAFEGGFGIDYCGKDLEACSKLGATWSRHTGVTTPILAQRALDEAESLNMKLVIRMSQGDWGWDGRQFDLSQLEAMKPVFNHPALIGFYGLHEPLERFSLEELQLFYQQYRDIVTNPDILLWHDIMRIPAGFEDGICDLCGVATNPHIIDPHTGEAANDWSRTDPRLEEALRNIGGSSRSQICVLVQVYGGDGRNFLRMPLPSEYRENLRRIVEEHGIHCVANYSFYHNAYKQTLGQAEQVDLRVAVEEGGREYFGQ